MAHNEFKKNTLVNKGTIGGLNAKIRHVFSFLKHGIYSKIVAILSFILS